MANEHLLDQEYIKTLIEEGAALKCIKYIKDITGWGLKDSKEYYDLKKVNILQAQIKETNFSEYSLHKYTHYDGKPIVKKLGKMSVITQTPGQGWFHLMMPLDGSDPKQGFYKKATSRNKEYLESIFHFHWEINK